jgi:hypothetical protein
MKRSIVIIALVIAAVVIIPLVAQTSRSGNAEKACPMGQGECQGQVQACKTQCEEGKNCEECPEKASGECQGCEKQCEETKGCDKAADAACEGAQGACGMMGQGMGQGSPN